MSRRAAACDRFRHTRTPGGIPHTRRSRLHPRRNVPSLSMSSTTWTEPSSTAPKEEGSRLGRNLTALLGGQAVTWSMTLLWTLIVPRALGPAGLGLLVTAMSVCGVVSLVLGLGTRTYIMREIVVDPASAPRLIGTGIVLRRSRRRCSQSRFSRTRISRTTTTPRDSSSTLSVARRSSPCSANRCRRDSRGSSGCSTSRTRT